MNKKETNIWRDFYNKLKQPDVKRRFRIGYQVVWNLFLLFIVLAILGAAFAGGVGAGYFASLVKDEPIRSKEELSKSIYNYEETSEVFFASGESLGTLRTDLVREEIPLEEMSDYLKDAIIATEDEYFYEHEGVVPKAILRAMLQEVSNSSVQSGGSTLTQQLIKQQVLTNEVSFSRKAKEILLALRIETFFEKEDILEAYLNVSPFGRNSSGRNIAGAQAAAEGLFGINAKDLNLAQAAYIAGLPQSPFGYTPFTNKGEIKADLTPGLNRQKFVLSRMLKAGSITESQYNEAIAYDITKDFSSKKDFAYEKYPALTTEIEKRSIKIIAKYLAEQEGISAEEYDKSEDIREEYASLADQALRQNGYVIHTTINKGMYDGMNKAKNEYKNYGYDKNEDVYNAETKETETVVEPVETGAMLIENKTGKILSFVGGRDFSREATNHATSPRMTGSTIKPILVYAPAIELGQIAPGSLMLDAPISIPAGGKTYEPKNYGNGYKGLMTARTALEKSQNIPAVTTYMGIINQNPLNYLKDMGVTTVMDSDYGLPATSITGPTFGISVEENTNAYAALANGGKFVDAYMIEKIETKKGELIYQHEAATKDVFSPQTSYLTIDMMRDVISSGTAVSLNNRIAFRSDFAGKTGTSQDYHDAWFIASNPNVTLGVWTGYDTPKTLNYLYNGLNYSKRNIYLWADLMNAAYKVDNNLIGTQERFKMPGGLVSKSYCSLLNLPGNVCTAAGIGTDLFPANFTMNLPEGTTTNGRFVTIGDKRYAALPSTPAEFVEAGTVFSDEFIKFIGGKYVSSEYLAQYVGGGGTSASVLKDDGRAPLPMTLGLANGTTIAWQTHTDRDVIGYRVYKDNVKVATIKAGTALSYSGSAGTYIVKAVDIAGKESPASNAIIIQGAPAEPEPPIVPPVAAEPPAAETPPAATPEPPPETEAPEPSSPPGN